jgi:branched-chain amino acid transport system substrate-binding protein
MSRHSRALVPLLPLTAVAMLIVGCPADRPVTVGVVAPLTGPWAVDGQPVVNGIELARRQLAEDPDFPRRIELDVRDSEGDPDGAAEHLRALFEDGALVAIGGITDPEAREMVSVVKDEDRVLISPSATWPGLTGSSPLFFRIAPSGFREGAKMGNFAAQELKIFKVAILAPASTDGEEVHHVFRSELERYGGEAVAVVEYPAGTTDFGDPVAEALAAAPEAVYVTGDAFEIIAVIERLREQGFRGRILTTHALAGSGVLDRVGESAEGVLLTQAVFDPESDDPVVRRFVDAYVAEHGTRPDSLAAQGYDAMMVVGEVLRHDGVATTRDLYKELRNLHDFVGAAGPVQFDEKGDVGKFPRVYAIKDGELVDFESVIEEQKRVLQKKLEDLRRRQREAARRAP